MSQQERQDRRLQLAAQTPRFSTLTICVRGALRGWGDSVVRHMMERNREVEMMREMARLESNQRQRILRTGVERLRHAAGAQE